MKIAVAVVVDLKNRYVTVLRCGSWSHGPSWREFFSTLKFRKNIQKIQNIRK